MAKILLVFFQSLSCSVILRDKTGQTRSLVLLCLEISSVPDHLQGDVLAVNTLHLSRLLEGCHLRKFLVLFSPVTGV